MVKNRRAEKKFFSAYHCHSLLMDLGKDQHQHPTVHSGELAGGGSVAVAVGVSEM